MNKNNSHVRIDKEVVIPLRLWCVENEITMKEVISKLTKNFLEDKGILDSSYRWKAQDKNEVESGVEA